MGHQLAGKRILIAEDDYLIAITVADAVAHEGGEVIGPVPIIAEALRALATMRVDGAILNVGLRDGDCYPVADALIDRGIPFMFATGYDKLPELYARVPRLAKPAPASQLARALAGILSCALPAS